MKLSLRSRILTKLAVNQLMRLVLMYSVFSDSGQDYEKWEVLEKIKKRLSPYIPLPDKLHSFVFELFLKLRKREYHKLERNDYSVYDRYGIIDTLGYNSSKSPNTYSYSDEFRSIYAIRLTKNFYLSTTSYGDDKYVCISKLSRLFI